MPQARLVGRGHRAPEILLERIEDRHAAKAGAADQHAVRRRRTGSTDLLIERLDLLLEAQALGDQLARREVAPFAPRVIAMMAAQLEAMLLVVGQRRLDDV